VKGGAIEISQVIRLTILLNTPLLSFLLPHNNNIYGGGTELAGLCEKKERVRVTNHVRLLYINM
jgi:hypothetical protein